MWIKHIILENFASIKVGMKTDRLEIDFSRRKNKICLLVAPNGTGKTSLLSTLTPFASLGNLDVRDSNNLIITGKNGYKEITIVDGEDEYLIKHFYSPNKDKHSVKSYIEKNGEELNINGNVRSFQAIVETELGIELGFLKLIRLGNNVTNLLQMTATERKKFLSNLLSDLDVYLSIHKKLTDDARLLKTQISHLTDKTKRTGIEDETKSLELLEFLRSEIAENTERKELLIKESGAINSQLKEINISEVQSEISSLEKKIKKGQKALENSKTTKSLSEYEKEKELLEKQIQSLDKEISSLSGKVELLIENMDSCKEDIRDVKRQIEKEETDENLSSAEKIFFDLRKKVSMSESQFKEFKVLYTKDDLETLFSTLIHCQNILDNLYEFGKKPINKVVELMRGNHNISNYINNGLLDHDPTLMNTSSLLTKFLSDMETAIPECDHKSCSLYKIWIEVKNLQRQEEVKRESGDGEEFYKYMDITYKRFMEVFDKLKEVKSIIEKLPNDRKSDFKTDVILNKISKLEPIFDRSKYNVLLTEITEYDNFKETVDKCKEAETTYNVLKKSSNLSYFQDRLSKLTEKESSIKGELSIALATLSEDKEKIKELNYSLEDITDTIEALSKMDELTSSLSENKATSEKFFGLTEQEMGINKKIQELDFNLSKQKQTEINIQVAISEFHKLQNELAKFMKLYNENFYIKRSMSAKEGIPLEYVNIYMSNIKETINELLDIVYDGSLYVEGFNISSDLFQIPYVKDGHLIEDIVSASQGETSFLSIALSFALIAKSILKYNIVLLDEIDGNLDEENRKKFIAVLERLIDLIGSEQIFLISHNNLFSMYPVDIISLDGKHDHGMKLSNYLPVQIG